MKITKKAIKKAPEYMLVIDWKAEKREQMLAPFTYKLMNAADVFEAMNEAERHIDDTVYLVKLLKKTGKIDNEEKPEEALGIIYSAVLCNRKNGWHTNDYDHSEGRFEATYNPTWIYSPITFYRGE